MTHQSDVEMLYADLAASVDELNDARPSPVRVRRAFARFIGLTQQLTAAMRREFAAKTGQLWSASDFSGWNAVSRFFKALRNIDQHDSPVLILVRERQTIQAMAGSAASLTLEGTWELHDQLADTPPEGLVLLRGDPVTGEPTDEVIPPTSRERDFLLHARTEELGRLLNAAGSADVHELSAVCLNTLTAYVNYYRARISMKRAQAVPHNETIYRFLPRKAAAKSDVELDPAVGGLLGDSMRFEDVRRGGGAP